MFNPINSSQDCVYDVPIAHHLGMKPRYAKKLYDKFVEEYDSPLCKDVQKKIFGRSFNLLDPKEYEEFEKAGAHVDKCPDVSGKVARWTAEILLNELKKSKKY